MTLTKTDKDKILTLLRSGETPTSIARIVKVSKASVYRVLHENGLESKDERSRQPPSNEPDTGQKRVDGSEDGLDKEQKKEEGKSGEHIEDKLISRTVDGYIAKASNELSTMMKDDLVISLNAGAILRREELNHRAEVEEVGLKWEEYVQWAMETAYQLFERALIQKIQEEEYEKNRITPEKFVEARVIGRMGRL